MTLRRIEAVALDKPTPPLAGGLDDRGQKAPLVEWLDPAVLYVDDAYQRDPTQRSLRLVRKVAGGNWDWSKFTPPTVTVRQIDGADVLCVIDGQHTAIMALTRGIRSIPCIIVETANAAADAGAFVGKNRDKTGITALQQHKAAVASGDEDAQTIVQVCERAGVTIAPHQRKREEWRPCETIAVDAIAALIRGRHAMGARKVLDVLVEAKMRPILARDIATVDVLMNGPDFAAKFNRERCVALLRDRYMFIQKEASVFANTHRVPVGRAMVATMYRLMNGRSS